MSARINLAPEVYQTSQRNKRRKKLATTVTVGVAIACTAVVGVLILIIVSQKGVLLGLQNSIDGKVSEIKGMKDLQAAVSLSDHLDSWNSMNKEKTYLSQFFTVLQDFAPEDVGVSSVTISDANVLQVNASAKSFALATKFAKALDAANVEIGPNAAGTNTPYFSGTELSSVSEESNGVVTFKLTTNMSSEVTHGKN